MSPVTVGTSAWVKTISLSSLSWMAWTTGSSVTELSSSVGSLLPSSEEEDAERLTMTVTMADAVPLETVMEVAPVPTAVITPDGLTVAMLLLADL